MAEEIKKFNQFQEENQSKEDNRLPYESPLLRKHGTLRDLTKSVIFPGVRFDSRFASARGIS